MFAISWTRKLVYGQMVQQLGSTSRFRRQPRGATMIKYAVVNRARVFVGGTWESPAYSNPE